MNDEIKQGREIEAKVTEEDRSAPAEMANAEQLSAEKANAEQANAEQALPEQAGENPEFEELLTAVEAGEDISEKLDEPAAGETSGGSGDETGQGAIFAREIAEVNVNAGFDPDVTFLPPIDLTANTEIVESSGDQSQPPAPNVISIGDDSVVEGGVLTFTVIRTGEDFSIEQSVTVNTSNGSALAPDDYEAVNGLVVTFGPGETEKVVEVPTVDDDIDEPTENLSISLSAPTGGATIGDGFGVGTITDNDEPPPPAPNVISIGDDSVVEGGVLTFTVIRTGEDFSIEQSVTVNTSNGSALAPDDYEAVNGLVVTFGPGETEKVVEVPTVDDDIDEPTENLSISLSAPTGGATIGDGFGVGTITDNDTTNISVTVNTEGGLVPEGEDAVFTVQVTGAAAGDTLALSLAPSGSDPATEGVDYKTTTFEYSTDGGATWTSTGEGDAIALSPGNSSLLVRTDTFDDAFDEADETFDLTATISDSGAVEKGTDSATATIVDDDTTNVSVTVNTEGGLVPEGEDAVFTVQVTGAAAGDTLALSLAPSGSDPATEGVDYKTTTFEYSTDGGATWTSTGEGDAIALSPGNSSLLVRTDTFDDAFDEADETFDLTATISDSGAVEKGTDSATATIVDDDTTNVSVTVNTEGGLVPEGEDAVFTVQVTGAAAGDTLALSLAPSGSDPATEGVDYKTTTFEYSTDGGATWTSTGEGDAIALSPGNSSLLVRTDTFDDAFDEADETFDLTATISDSGAVEKGTDSATATIVDDDTTNVSVTVNTEGGLVPEGEDAVFTVQVTGAAAGDTLALSLAPSGSDPATEGVDYKTTTFEYSTDGGATWTSTGEGDAIALSPGNSSLLVRTDTFDDAFDEADETFDLTATISDSGAVEKGTDSATATIVDDDTTNVSVTVNTEGGLVPEGEDAVFTVQVTGAAAGDTLALSLAPSGSDPATEGVDYKTTTFEYSTDGGATWTSTGEGDAIALSPGNSSLLVRTDTFDDAFDEADETFDLTATISDSGAVEKGTDSATATIVDDDTTNVSVTVNTEGGLVPEGEDAVFTVQVTGAAAGDTLALSLAPSGSDPATEGVDYKTTTFEYSTDGGATWTSTGEGDAIALSPGNSSLLVRTDTFDDAFDEADETFDLTATISDSGAVEKGTDSATATIVDDDTTNVSVTVNTEGGLVPEGEDAVFTVQVTGAAAGDTLALSLAPSGSDPATEGVDYKTTTFEYSTDGGATWTSTGEGDAIALSPGNSSLLVRTDTFDDAFDEADETFDLTATISDSGAVEKGTDSATATIVDNDLRVDIHADGIGDVVDETALPGGYIPGSDGEFAQGSFTFINSGKLDDLESVTIEGEVILMADLEGSEVTTGHGKITINTYNSATGVATYTYQLLGPVNHASGPVNDLISISVTDGTNSSSAEIAIGIEDDGPASTDKNGVINNAAGESLVGVIDFDTNADGLGTPVSGGVTLSLTGTSSPLKSDGKAIDIAIQDGNGDGLQELIGYVDSDNDDTYDAGEEVFTLSANSGSGDEGIYTLVLHEVLDLPVTTIEQGFGDISAGGPSGEIAVFTDGTETEANLLLSGDRVNPSNGFVGAEGDNNMNAGEVIKLEFGDVNLTTFEIGPRLVVNDAVFETKDIGTGGSIDTFNWTAIKAGSVVGSDTQTFDGGSKTSAIHVDGGYDTLVIEVTAGGFKLGTLTYTDTSDPTDVDLLFGYSVKDADGDSIDGEFTATVSDTQPTLLASTGDFIAHLDSRDDSSSVVL